MADDEPGWATYSVVTHSNSNKTITYTYDSCPDVVKDRNGKCPECQMVFFRGQCYKSKEYEAKPNAITTAGRSRLTGEFPES